MADVHGHGGTLSIGGTTVGSITNLSGPNKNRGTVDVTSFDSPERTREYVALRYADSGDLTIDLKYVASTATDSPAKIIRIAYKGNVTQEYILTLSNDEAFTCDAHITALGHEIPVDDKVSQSLTVKLTGKGVWS